MAYTALELIIEAYYLSGIVANTSQPTGAQSSRGLALLNSLLALKSSNVRLVPYATIQSFNTVAGQEAYTITNLISVDTLTYVFSGSLRTPLVYRTPAEYFGDFRINNLTTLPGSYTVERVKGGAKIYIYPLPDAIYSTQIVGRFGLSAVTKTTDLSLTYDGDYIQYLMFSVGRYICLRSNISFPPASLAEYMLIEKQLTDRNPLDLTYQKISLFNCGSNSINYGIANLSNGWLP
jgi:hypothetical protein